MSAFFAMDGYAAYVWSSYALTAAGIGALVYGAIAARRRAKARLDRLQRLDAEETSKSEHGA